MTIGLSRAACGPDSKHDCMNKPDCEDATLGGGVWRAVPGQGPLGCYEGERAA